MKKEDPAMENDTQLQKLVMDELKYEPTIHAAEIGVAVKDMVVTLNGNVDCFAQKWAADRAVKRVFGVRALTNGIKVTLANLQALSDVEISQAATKVLAWNYWVPKDRVKVNVLAGQITLIGEVDYFYQKERAEESVRHLVGVAEVINRISIKPPQPVLKDREVKSRIEDALKRNARLLLAAQKIRVDSSGSKVILHGSVGSLAEREEAESSAWAAPGVSEVENNLTVSV
jgi:osmotically-inducible protein OsmY